MDVKGRFVLADEKGDSRDIAKSTERQCLQDGKSETLLMSTYLVMGGSTEAIVGL